jgi:hypothetical protein
LFDPCNNAQPGGLRIKEAPSSVSPIEGFGLKEADPEKTAVIVCVPAVSNDVVSFERLSRPARRYVRRALSS